MQQPHKQGKLNLREIRQVLLALDAILASERFTLSPRMSMFLRYIVVQAIEGKRDRISALAVAREALEKPARLGLTDDPVVRTLANKLRTSLLEYYSKYPDTWPRIILKKGSYVPEFIQSNGRRISSRLTNRVPQYKQELLTKIEIADRAANDPVNCQKSE
ncbi:MAG: hypothetical protein KTR32_10235 [Granulosicoccus sp.]|nr:hypothetical protein [Granulosicoccus sp.]